MEKTKKGVYSGKVLHQSNPTTSRLEYVAKVEVLAYSTEEAVDRIDDILGSSYFVDVESVKEL